MKIVFTVATYYPAKNGVQYVTQYQAEYLAQEGHEVIVITSDRNSKQNEEMVHGVKVIRINAYNKNMFHFGDKSRFIKLVMEQCINADVLVNVCLQSFAADWILKFLKDVNCKKILIMHSMHDFRWGKSDKQSIKSVLKKILRNARWGIFYNVNWKYIIEYNAVTHLHEDDYSLKYFEKHGYDKNYILYNAVENIFFEENQKENQIISVASFNSRKNQLLALKAFYEADTQDYKLVFIGTPRNQYYNMLIKTKDEYDKVYGKKSVEILVDLDRKQTVEYIRKSKIYLMTSLWEGFPISIIEAMASKCAFISTRVGIVDKLPGGVICDSYDELVGSIENLLQGEWKKYADEGNKYATEHMKQDGQGKEFERIICL